MIFFKLANELFPVNISAISPVSAYFFYVQSQLHWTVLMDGLGLTHNIELSFLLYPHVVNSLQCDGKWHNFDWFLVGVTFNNIFMLPQKW